MPRTLLRRATANGRGRVKTQKYSVFRGRFTPPGAPPSQHSAIWRVVFLELRAQPAFSHGLGRVLPHAIGIPASALNCCDRQHATHKGRSSFIKAVIRIRNTTLLFFHICPTTHTMMTAAGKRRVCAHTVLTTHERAGVLGNSSRVSDTEPKPQSPGVVAELGKIGKLICISTYLLSTCVSRGDARSLRCCG